MSIGSILPNENRQYSAKIQLFIVKENGDFHYCSTADAKYIFDRIHEKSKIQRPMIELEQLLFDGNKFLTVENTLKIYIEVNLVTF